MVVIAIAQTDLESIPANEVHTSRDRAARLGGTICHLLDLSLDFCYLA